MPIQKIRKIEELGEGTKLVARYKGKEYAATILRKEDGSFAVGSDVGGFKSLSAAGKAITGGACNGWAFWSLDGELKPAREPKAKAEAKPKAATKRIAKSVTTKGPKRAAKAAEAEVPTGEPAREPAEDAA